MKVSRLTMDLDCVIASDSPREETLWCFQKSLCLGSPCSLLGIGNAKSLFQEIISKAIDATERALWTVDSPFILGQLHWEKMLCEPEQCPPLQGEGRAAGQAQNPLNTDVSPGPGAEESEEKIYPAPELHLFQNKNAIKNFKWVINIQAQWLTPIIWEIWEAEVGILLKPGSSTSACET